MKLFSLLPKRLVHLACNSPADGAGQKSKKRMWQQILKFIG